MPARIDYDEMRKTVDAERLNAAEEEFERQDRVRRVCVLALEMATREAREISRVYIGYGRAGDLVGRLEAITETLRGEWIKSPKTMAAERAAGDKSA